MVKGIQKRLEEYTKNDAERVFATLFATYRCILEDGSGNNFDTPQSGVRSQHAKGEVVIDPVVSDEL